MEAWSKDQGVEGSMISFMGDPSASLTKTLGMEMNHPGPEGVGIIGRCKRHAVYLVDGVVKYFKVSEKADDPAGDDFPEDTCAPALLEAIKSFKDEL